MSMIKVEDLSAAYGKRLVLEKVSFQVGQGEIFGILGSNGSGKSTLIKSICNILPHQGNCYCDSHRLEDMSAKELATYCSYIPQKSGLSIEMSVLDVILMGFNPKLKLFENPSSDMIDRARKILAQVGFSEKIDDNFMDLSEGQKQLCMLLRALVADSRLILMDEPESALDVSIRHRMMKMIRQWTELSQSSVIVALHDIELALNNCDRLLLISEGRTVGILSPKSDKLEDMEQALAKLYGKICLREIEDSKGKLHLVMLKEEEL